MTIQQKIDGSYEIVGADIRIKMPEGETAELRVGNVISVTKEESRDNPYLLKVDISSWFAEREMEKFEPVQETEGCGYYEISEDSFKILKQTDKVEVE